MRVNDHEKSSAPNAEFEPMSLTDSVTAGGHGLDARKEPLSQPITVEDRRMLEEGEVLEGYLDGVHGNPITGCHRSRSYLHGWRQGMIDRDPSSLDETAPLRRGARDRSR